MAEFELNELTDLRNANMEYNEAAIDQNRLHMNLRDLEEQIAKGESSAEKLDERKATKAKLNEANIAKDKAISKYQTSFKNFKEALAKKIDIKPEKIDFTKSYNDMDPKLQKFISSQTDEFIENVKKFQEKYGGEKTNKWLEKIEKGSLKLLLFSGVIGVITSGLMYGSDAHDWFSKHNYNFHANRAVGCYQYHIPSGAIRTMGVCGLEKKCAALSEGECNEQQPSGICTWNTYNNRCTAGSLVTNAQSCSSSCKVDSDCNTIDKVSCKTPSDCKIGDCVNGYCLSQTCDPNTLTCTPVVPPNPNWDILDHIENGKIGFCLGDGMGTACAAATLICDVQTNGGACESCDENDPSCLSPSGEITTVADCMCTNLYGLNQNATGWITLPVCQPANSFITAIAYMNSISNNWVPQKTPLVIQILTWLGVVLFLITLIWYVIYLIKHGKK